MFLPVQEVLFLCFYLLFCLYANYTCIEKCLFPFISSRKERVSMFYPRIRDYNGTALVILILYLVGWIPGFIVNAIQLVVALFEKDSYDNTRGFGCLVWLFLICGLGPLVGFALAFIALHFLY